MYYFLDSCLSSQFRCGDGKCISIYSKCDGMKHCSAGEDEEGCEDKEKCAEFTCDDGTCESNDSLCDGFQDCPDNSDELVGSLTHADFNSVAKIQIWFLNYFFFLQFSA